MRVFLTSTVLLALAWALHLVVWRVRVPAFQIRALLAVFALVIAGWLVPAVVQGVSWLEIAQVALFYISMALSYVITYSAIEGDSPTLSLVRTLANKGGAGLSEEGLEEFVRERPFVKTRLAALVHSGLVREKNGFYVLCGKPSLFFRVILAFRKLYGRVSQGG